MKSITRFAEIDTSTWSSDHLVLIDIDDTLVVPKERIIRNCNRKQRSMFLKSIETNLGSEMVDRIFEYHGYIYVDDNITSFIDKINKKDIAYIAITARRTGYASPTSRKTAQDKILGDLAKIGFAYDPKLYPNNANIILSHQDIFSKIDETLEQFYQHHGPMIKEGIIFCCNINKNEILSYYMNMVLDRPKKIILIDDSIKNLQLVKKYCEQRDYEHELYYFEGAKLLDNEITDKEINNRIKYMCKHKMYASEEQFNL